MAYQQHLDLTGADLAGADLAGVDLAGAILTGVDLTGAILTGANLTEADLAGADLTGADLNGVKLIRVNLNGVSLAWADLTGANLTGASLAWADLTQANLNRAILTGADLTGANLNGAILTGADLTGANLNGAILTGADLTGANLNGAILTGADLTGANLNGAILAGSTLTQANLNRASLTGATLAGARVEWTIFGDVNLSMVKGIDAMNHLGPSTIGIDTIYRSQGNISEAFLRDAGVPDAFLAYMRSLIGQPFDFFSCFISYSSKDHAFAERLRADLQSKGVRCWSAPEDMKIGDEMRSPIDEAIRLYDKLLLVLSEHSVASTWAKKAVETAFEKEQQQRRLMLFPVRLDDAVMQTSQAWAADIRRMRHIGDFRRWKSHDEYQKALSRLLRDLKAEQRI